MCMIRFTYYTYLSTPHKTHLATAAVYARHEVFFFFIFVAPRVSVVSAVFPYVSEYFICRTKRLVIIVVLMAFARSYYII